MLELFVDNGIEIAIDTNTGNCFYPGYRSLARVCSLGLEKPIYNTQVKRAIDTIISDQKTLKLIHIGGETDVNEKSTLQTIEKTEILTTSGVRGETLIPRQLGIRVIKRLNENLYDVMAEAGQIEFLHRLVKFQKKEVKFSMDKLIREVNIKLIEAINELEIKLAKTERKGDIYHLISIGNAITSVTCGNSNVEFTYSKLTSATNYLKNNNSQDDGEKFMIFLENHNFIEKVRLTAKKTQVYKLVKSTSKNKLADAMKKLLVKYN